MQTFTVASILGLAAIAAAQGAAQASAGAVSPKTNSCQSAYTQCSSSGAYGVDCNANKATCVASCEAKSNSCRTAYGANEATCSAQYANCLGYDPYANTAPAQNTTTTVVAVVMSYTTYCPYATSFTNNGQVYVATTPGYVTVTNCPCTVTSGVASATASTPAVAVKTSASSNVTYTGPKYTGAGSKVVGAGLSVVAAAAGIFAFAL